MAPTKIAKNRKSSASGATKSPATTPDRSPIKKHAMITQRQKQALIDNLQLEITERARKLRAHYALQAQSLRTRVELRINRIPTAMRKTKMGELVEKYLESQKRDEESARPKAVSKKAVIREDQPEPQRQIAAPAARKPRGVKRNSHDMLNADKENTPDPSIAVPMPKKRVKDGTTARGAILSPKSSNSRTLPQSPVRPPPLGSPSKAQAILRPQSPLKHTSPIKAAAAAATASLANMVSGKRTKSGASATTTNTSTAATVATTTRKTANATTGPKPVVTRSTRGAIAATGAAASGKEKRTASESSNASGTSTGTMIVKKVGKALASTAGKRGAAKTTTAAKTAVQKKAAPAAAKAKVEKAKAEAPAHGRRVLRKRA